jgi:DNA polymerase-1
MKLLSADTIRRCLIADPGQVILSADFDQIELRIAAAFAGEQILIDAAKRGDHLIKASAVQLWGEDYNPDQYRYTKNVTYGWLFGGGAKTLSEQTGLPIGECQKMTTEYGNTFTALSAYKRSQTQKIIDMALTPAERKAYRELRNRMRYLRDDTAEGRRARWALQIQIDRLMHGKIGYVTTPFGRRLIVEASKAYTVLNYKVQSTARDLMATALLDVLDDPELEPTVLLPIHDEILGQAPRRKAERIAQRYGEVMSRDFMGVPITASGKVYGKSWGHGYAKEAQNH